MATFYWHTRSVLRSKVSSVVGLAAYRAGERLRSTYHGRVHDWSARRDIEHKEVILPQDLARERDMLWAYDRGTLWDQVEHHETGETPRLARRWLMHLPSELSREQRRELSVAYAREIADKYRCAVDVCVNEPRPESDGQHYHVHLMTTVREVSPLGFGALISLEVPAIEGSYKQECGALRVRWAELTNASLERAGVAERVDHRTPEERGLTPAPILKLPEKLFYQERDDGDRGKGDRDKGPSAAGDALRARHHAPMAAYEQGPEVDARACEEYAAQAQERDAEQRRQQPAKPPSEPRPADKPIRRGALTHEQLKEKRRQEYQAEREQLLSDPEALALARAKGRERMREWRAANRERDAQNRRDWEQRNPERVKAKAKRYYQAHAAEIAERKKAKYYADLEVSRSKVRASYRRCAARIRLLNLTQEYGGENLEARRRKVLLKVIEDLKHREEQARETAAGRGLSPGPRSEPAQLSGEEQQQKEKDKAQEQEEALKKSCDRAKDRDYG